MSEKQEGGFTNISECGSYDFDCRCLTAEATFTEAGALQILILEFEFELLKKICKNQYHYLKIKSVQSKIYFIVLYKNIDNSYPTLVYEIFYLQILDKKYENLCREQYGK